ncbi:MAG: AmmeMemoRadiSam system radical SAM enzyme [Candidatus Altiarchaeota archaeon]|nr:AmmeMemoRadiSam system radical SAM enzyme [Candidatus Altiarchaeota archaeon]
MKMKEAMFYEKIEDNKVRCGLCARNCVIPEGGTGFCRVRKNIGGRLYSLVYDKVNSTTPNPIEKKPCYNFAPGSWAFSICTPGCNWRCKYCCNWSISQESEIEGRGIAPEEIVQLARNSGCQGISYTFTEPTIFYELSYDTAKLAHKEGLYNTWVTNGYTNPEPIKEISRYLDAATVDFKGSGDEKFLQEFSAVPTPEPIYKALMEYKKQDVHIEITDLIVPRVGDSMEKVKELVEWIKENLGDETPIHFLRFFPTYQVRDIPETPLKTLEKAYDIAKAAGMKYVYLGNVAERNNTYCPNCKKLLIKRQGMGTIEYKLKEGKCPYCGEEINIRGVKWIPSGLKQ